MPGFRVMARAAPTLPEGVARAGRRVGRGNAVGHLLLDGDPMSKERSD